MDWIRLEQNVLRVRGDLTWEHEALFDRLAGRLVRVGSHELVLDLRGVSFLFSPFMSRIVRLHMDCRRRGKLLAIEIPPQLESLFRDAGFFEHLDIRVLALDPTPR